jgi:hypothetical protein
MTKAMCQAASEALTKRAKAHAADLAPTIAELQAAGATSLRTIAVGLNERGIPTARGTATWFATRLCACWHGARPISPKVANWRGRRPTYARKRAMFSASHFGNGRGASPVKSSTVNVISL